MKKLKLFFACLLMAVLSIGQVWAVDPTISWDFKTLQTTSGTQSGITWETGKTGSATATACNGTNGLVLYGVASGGGYFQTTSAISGTITNVNIVSTAKKNTPKYTVYCSTDGSTWDEIAASQTAGTKDHAVTGSYTYVKVANTTAATAQLGVASITVTYTPSGGGSTPSLSVDPTVIDFGTVEQNAVVASQTVEVSFANLTGSVAYSGLSSPFTASGTISSTGDEITIAANTANVGNYSQTLTVQSTADSKSAEVTVKMNVVEPFDGLKLTFDFVTHPEGWPAAKASAAAGNYVYTISATDYTFAHSKVGDGIYCGGTSGSSGYLMIAKSNSLGLPAISGYKLVKVEGTLNNSGTPSTKAEITITNGTDEVTGGASQTWDEKGVAKTYNLSGTVANTMYYLNVSGTANLQMITLVLYYEEAEAPTVAAPTISGVTPFLSSTSVTITQNDADHIYYTTDGSAPTTGSTLYEGPFELNATATVKAIAIKDEVASAVAEKTFTKITPLTVAEAIAAIPNKDDVVNNQYVEGIVCTAGTSVNASGQMTYYISADGTEATRLQIYLGKNLNNTAFTAVSDLAIGDRVVVFGQLKNYNNTPEMNSGNYLVLKETPAVAAPVFSPDGGGFMGETDVTITCATASSTIYYTLDGATPTKSSSVYDDPIHLNATTTITAVAYVGDDASLVIAKTFTLTAPMTVAEALAALESENPINNVAVAGIISTAPTANPSSGKLTYFISDDGSASDELEVYKGFGVAGASFSDKTDLQVGDVVTVFGNLTIYNTTKEFAEGSRLIAFNRPQVDVESISLTESTAEVEEGKTVTLHASVVPANATNKTIVWSVQSGDTYASVDENGVVTGIAAGEAVIRAASDEDATIFAECTVTVTEPAPLSPWASVYTSNVELSGSQNVKVTITVDEEDKNFDGVKMNKAAAATFTIPAGTTNLYAHMAAWNGEAQTVTVSGDCFDADKSIDIVADANISGSGTTYDIDDAKAPTDYFKEIVLDKEVTEPTEITITAASGKRFVLFGVNQVGGIALESIAISGTASNLEYNDGDHFNPAGLVVTGHYSNGSDAAISDGIDWAFDPDPLTQGTTSVSVTATVDAISSPAFVVNGLTVSGAAPLSPWATVYTSNVELSGSQNVKVTITVDEEDKNFDGVKMNKAAAATFTIPAGTTNLYAHMAAWNGEAQTVTVSGDCFDADKSIDIVADANISGSGTTYDIDDAKAPTDYFKEIVLDKEVTEPTEITITAASGKRFVLFGVNQVGGVLPVLKSIEISGDLTTKSGYKAGDALDLDGLTVSAIYTLNDVDQAPVDVTSLVNWSYDPLVEGQTSVTITATLEDKSDDITISDLEAVASADPKIYVEPSLTVNFGSVVVGEAVPANKTITVTLTNVAAATATLGGTNPEAFSIDKTALVDGDVITISVIASTAAAASYSATITITDNAAAATEKVVNLSFAVTEPVVEESPVSTDTKWVPATEIADGMQVLITGVKSDDVYAMGEQKNNNRAAVAASVDGEGVLTPGENTMAFTLVAQGDGTYALRTSNGKYLYAAASGSNYLKTQDEVDVNAKWTMTVASASAEGSSNRHVMQFNTGSTLFSCYASAGGSGMAAIKLYVPKPVTPPTPVYETVRTGLVEGRHYTVCLENNVTAVKGATFWSLTYKNAAGTEAYLVQENAPFAAGTPYIIQATGDNEGKLEVVYGEEVAGSAGTNGALVGTFSYLDAAALNTINETGENDVYMLFNNELRPIGTENHLDAHRAYVLYNLLTPASPSSFAPGKTVKGMPMHRDAAQGFENLQSGDAPVKVMIDGTLYILRGEKVYDATGRLVK